MLTIFSTGYCQIKIDSIDNKIVEIYSTIDQLLINDSVFKDSLSKIRADLDKIRNQKENYFEKFSSNWIPILSFMIALFTIFFGWKAIIYNRKMKLYELVLDVTTEYASEEMLAGILIIRNWEKDKKRKNKDFAKEFGDIRKQNYDKIKDIDIARRKISHFFHRIFLLNENEVINEKEIMKIITSGQIDILLDLIEPLEESINKDYNIKMFDFFRDIKKQLEQNGN